MRILSESYYPLLQGPPLVHMHLGYTSNRLGITPDQACIQTINSVPSLAMFFFEVSQALLFSLFSLFTPVRGIFFLCVGRRLLFLSPLLHFFSNQISRSSPPRPEAPPPSAAGCGDKKVVETLAGEVRTGSCVDTHTRPRPLPMTNHHLPPQRSIWGTCRNCLRFSHDSGSHPIFFPLKLEISNLLVF